MKILEITENNSEDIEPVTCPHCGREGDDEDYFRHGCPDDSCPSHEDEE